MQITIHQQPHELTDIREFRAAHQLPPEFGVALFEPKDFTGLASIDRAGNDLKTVRDAMLSALPDQLNISQMFDVTAALATHFRAALYAVNERVNLKNVEIDFAVAGLEDVLKAVTFALVRSSATHKPPPPFGQIYGEWLDSSVRISQFDHPYTHQGKLWRVQIINTAYGRAGLVIHTESATHYVRDGALGCPAEGYMMTLLAELTAQIFAAVIA